MLYQWDPRALAIPDSLGRLPLNIARSRGHTRLAELLEQLQQSPPAQSQLTETWMERWRGESQTNGTNNNSAANLSSGWFYHQGRIYLPWNPFLLQPGACLAHAPCDVSLLSKCCRLLRTEKSPSADSTRQPEAEPKPVGTKSSTGKPRRSGSPSQKTQTKPRHSATAR